MAAVSELVDPSESKGNYFHWKINLCDAMLIVPFCFSIADRNSESAESVTNEDSSDNTIGPLSVNHNTTTAHDDIIIGSNSNITKNCGKIQTNHDGLGEYFRNFDVNKLLFWFYTCM